MIRLAMLNRNSEANRLRTAASGLRPRLRVLTFAVVLAIGGATALVATPYATVTPDRAWALPFFALVIAFGLAEASALHVEIRKESHSLSLSGIPLMFGLLYLSPVLLVTAYLLGSAPTMLWIRKSDWVKTTWNSCLFMSEAALAALLVRLALGTDLPGNVIEWLIPLGAILVAELMSLIAVPLVIMAADGKFRPNLFADVGQSQILATLAGTFTVTAVSASAASPYMAFYAIVPVVGVGAMLQSSGHLAQRHRDLQQLHTFTSALTNERGPRTVDVGLVELVQIMRTRSAGVLLIAHDEEQESSLRVLTDETFDDLDPTPVNDLVFDLLDDGPFTLLTIDDKREEVIRLLKHLRAKKMLAARVLGEVDQEGLLFVTDRLGMRSEFTADELRLFGSLANTLSARLSNDHLVGQLESQARHDALTGLPNRLSFEIALTASLAKKGQSGAVVMVDLDRFKEINDSLGHETGDKLLVEMARRLRSTMRSSDMVARFGGDEFAMLLTHLESDGPGDFAQRIDRVHASLTEKVDFDGITFEIGASLGVVQWPEQGTDSSRLLHRADTAMYEAKRNQLGVVWYTPDLELDAPRRLDLYMSVGAALENEELHVHFQPKVSLNDGHITGAEVLVRWTHPAHGPIPPLEFVPLIVQAGLTGKLTRFVIEKAVEGISTFVDAGIDIPVAVNFTPRDLLDPTLPDAIAEVLERHDVAPSSLQVEITEEAMVVDFETSVAVLQQLRGMGIKVAIDDFGTGYSSLQHLHRLPVDQLKIDRSFVDRLATDERASAIVRASTSLAAELGLTTIAEGVEDDYSLRAVQSLGCDEIQGFLVSRPVPVYDLVKWAMDWDPHTITYRMLEHQWYPDPERAVVNTTQAMPISSWLRPTAHPTTR